MLQQVLDENSVAEAVLESTLQMAHPRPNHPPRRLRLTSKRLLKKRRYLAEGEGIGTSLASPKEEPGNGASEQSEHFNLAPSRINSQHKSGVLP